MKTLIYEALESLTNQAPEKHAKIRQSLYEQLDLPFEQQLTLYSQALGPASSGILESVQAMNNAAESFVRLFETPER